MKTTSKVFILTTGLFTAAAAAAAVSYNTTKALVNAALDREAPKIMAKKKPHPSLDETDKYLLSQVESASKNLSQADTELIQITGHDGNNLVGHYYSCPDAKRIIIAMHGWRSSWSKDFGMISDFWHSSGCSVLYAEQRGQNNSGGEYMGFGMIERHDCLKWIEWADENNDLNLPIYLAGISMGASTVLMTAGFDLPDNVHGIMADCGFTSADAIWRYVTENNIGMSYSIRRKLVNDICKKKINIGFEDYTTLDAMKTNIKPILFIHGSDDGFVPIDMTYINYKACRAPKRIFIVPGAGHAMSYIENKDGYEQAMTEFWNEFDTKCINNY